MKKQKDSKSISFEIHGIRFTLERCNPTNGINMYCDSSLTEGGGWTALRTPVGEFWQVGDHVVETDKFGRNPIKVFVDSKLENILNQVAEEFVHSHHSRFKTRLTSIVST